MQKRELGSEVREMMTSLQLLNINSWASGFNMNRNRTFCKPRRQASHLHVRSKHSHFDSAAEEGGSGCTNYGPLSPISFLERAANFSAHTTSIVYGDSKFHWALTHQRCLKLASALSRLGVSRGHLDHFLKSLPRTVLFRFFRTNYITAPPNLRKYSNLVRNFDSESRESVEGLLRCSANFVPLSPVSFLERAANFATLSTSILYGRSQYNWGQTHLRCLKLASALTQLGISRRDVVATLLPNVPAMYELHFAVPMAGAILCTLNSRLDGAMVSVLLEHSQAKVLFVDYQLLEVARRALNLLSKRVRNLPILVLITDSDGSSTIDTSSVSYEYEELLSTGSSGFEIVRPNSEFDPISVNYTSGTTSRPKGVVFSHRGAYLNTLGTILLFGMGFMPVYLWTVPMFHCNGWCLPWGVAAQCGTNVCLRKVSPKDIFEKVTEHKVTHMGGAPTVLNMIVNSALTDRRPLTHKVVVVTGGAPPPPQILSKMEEIGFSVSHLYGLTETYGPGTSCEWRPEWDSVAPEEKYKRKARQGIPHVTMDAIDIKDPDTMKSVPADGKTMGEVMFRGNTVMSGYLRDSEATEEAFRGGWFHSGDVGVKHSDGYIEIKDRLKDIIISGGENISSVEVETVLYSHPAVLEAAVVARPDDHWGQTPCAFVSLKEGFSADAQEIIDFCRDHLPHYMAPKTVIFEDLPKTATGKIQKFVLREKAKAMGSLT